VGAMAAVRIVATVTAAAISAVIVKSLVWGCEADHAVTIGEFVITVKTCYY